MTRLEEIEARLADIEKELRSEDCNNLDALEEEMRTLISEKKELRAEVEKRAQLLDEIAKKETETDERNIIEMPEKRTFGIDTPEYRDAYMKKLMGIELDDQERAAMTASAAIPTTTLNKIVEKLESAPLLGRIDLISIPGNVTIPTEDTTNDATWTTGASTDSSDSISSLALTGHKLIKTIEIDAKVDKMSISAFEAYLVNKLTVKMEKALQAAVVVGTGSNQPTGLTKTSYIPQTATYAKAGLTYKNVTEIMGKLGGDYHAGASWTMPAATFFTEVLGMTDSNGRPVVVQDASVGSGYRLMGHPVDLVDAKADTIIFGLMSRYTMNLASDIEIAKDGSVGFRSGSQVYRGMCFADGGATDKSAFVVATKATA